MCQNLSVLVPKIRGAGFLRVPLGHHYDPSLDDLEQAAGCDIYGLDGSLDFMCGGEIASAASRRAEFETRVRPLLERRYSARLEIVGAATFWRLHPILQSVRAAAAEPTIPTREI